MAPHRDDDPAAALFQARSPVPAFLPDLIEPWQVISTSEEMGARSEVTVVAHTSFARAATLRLQMIRLIDQRLTEAGIELLD